MIEAQQFGGASVLQQPRLLEGFGARMLVHAPHGTADRVARICATEQLGAVYTIPRDRPGCAPSGYAKADTAIRIHRHRTGSTASLLLDAQLYNGKNRTRGTEPQDLGWTAHQHSQGLTWALTDSGFIAESDRAALVATLEEGARHRGQVIVALPMHSSWLSHHADEVRRRIDAAGHPVALMLEHRDDPLGARATLQGLLEVLQARVPVALLRCDISSIGALAYGAAIAAVGTRTGLRHIFPMGPGRPGSGKIPAAVVPRALAYRQLYKIREAVMADDDQTRWTCQCSWCAGVMLNGLFTEDDAFQHSLATLATLAQDVLSSPNPVSTWKSKCFDAQFGAIDIRQETGLDWPDPPFLKHWLTA